MAQKGKVVKLKNCVIDIDEGVFVESTKDGDLVHNINDILSEFDGFSGISVNISCMEDIEPISKEY